MAHAFFVSHLFAADFVSEQLSFFILTFIFSIPIYILRQKFFNRGDERRKVKITISGPFPRPAGSQNPALARHFEPKSR